MANLALLRHQGWVKKATKRLNNLGGLVSHVSEMNKPCCQKKSDFFRFWVPLMSMSCNLQGLIMLDLSKISSRGANEVVEKTRNAIRERLAMEEKFEHRSEKVYKTYEDALERLLESANMMHGENSVTEESARIILKRGLRPSNCGSGFVFTRDMRLVLTNLHGLSGDFLMEFARNIKCPHLLIKVRNTAKQLNQAARLCKKI